MPRSAVWTCGLAGLLAFALGNEPVVGAVWKAQPPVAAQGSGRGGQSWTANPGEPTRVGTGAISGVVTDGATGQPLQGALVQLFGPIVPSGDGGRGITMQRPRQRTDSRGRFIFTRLPAGDAYTVTATRQGYFDGSHRSRPGLTGGARVGLGDGEWFAKADIALWRPAAISGIVRDERGEPLVGVIVQPLLDTRVAGQVRRVAGPSAVTDDRGMYRIASLRPGRYVIHVPSIQVTLPDGTAAVGASPTSRTMANLPQLNLMRSTESGSNDGFSVLVGSFPSPSSGGLATAYPMMFHPSARSMDQATPVTVGFGEQRTSVDVQLMLVPSVRVTGRVVGPAEVLANLPVRLIPAGADELSLGAEAAYTITDAQGGFTFLRVPIGEYTVIASTTHGGYSAASRTQTRPLLPERISPFSVGSMSSGTVQGSDGMTYQTRGAAGPGAIGRSTVSVGERDIEDLVVPLTAGVTISGHFLWDGSETPPQGLRFAPSVRAEAADGNLALGLPFGGIGRPDPLAVPVPFSVRSVLPGRYIFGSSIISEDHVVEAIEYGGRDLMSTPLVVDGDKDLAGVVVRMTSKKTSLTGFVRSTTATTVNSGAVIFFPADRTVWQDMGLTAPRFASTSITASGSYRAPPLPPGEYYLAAVPDEDRQRFRDPEFLLTLVTNAARIRLSPGSQITQDLQMTGGRR